VYLKVTISHIDVVQKWTNLHQICIAVDLSDLINCSKLLAIVRGASVVF